MPPGDPFVQVRCLGADRGGSPWPVRTMVSAGSVSSRSLIDSMIVGKSL